MSNHQVNREILETAWKSILNLTGGSAVSEGLIGEDVVLETGIAEAAIRTMHAYPLVESLQDSCMGVLHNISSISRSVRRFIAQTRGIDEIVSSQNMAQFVEQDTLQLLGRKTRDRPER